MSLGFTCVVLAALVGVGAARADWTTFRGDPARTGHAARGLSAEPSVVWKTTLGGSVDGSPLVAGGVVYVGTNQGLFAAVDAASGAVKWRTQLEGAVCSAAALYGDRLLLGTSRRFLYCLTKAGDLVWRDHAWDSIVDSPLVIGGLCYWGSMDGVLHATRVKDGSLAWKDTLSGGISAACASDGKRLFVADEGGTVWALSPEDGKVVWKQATGCPAMAAPVVSDGRLLVPLVSPTRLVPPDIPYLLALDPATGAVDWRVVGARSVFASPLAAEGLVACLSVEGYLSDTFLRGFRADGGREAYKRRIGGVVDSSPAWSGDVAYFGAEDGCLYAVRISDGVVLSRLRLAPKVFSSPALDNGRLYIGASDGCLYCLQ